MKAKNPFNRKYIEKMLFGAHMSHAENKRKCRSFLRKMARHIESAWEIGRKDGQSGKPLIPLESLPRNDDSPMGREIARWAYRAYRTGHQSGIAERKEGC